MKKIIYYSGLLFVFIAPPLSAKVYFIYAVNKSANPGETLYITPAPKNLLT